MGDIDGEWDSDNIFAKIVRGEAPCAKVYEDQATLAFMDVFPQSLGHTLVIHKSARARNLLDAAPEEICALILSVQKISKALRKALNPDAVAVMQFTGAASGQSIYHLHFHVIPRWRGRPLGAHARGAADSGDLAELAKRIAAEI